uniref:C2 domain-containing protein n=1 Tax=Strigamia maritima TaxID=126957 RepID=T1IR75_STRMM
MKWKLYICQYSPTSLKRTFLKRKLVIMNDLKLAKGVDWTVIRLRNNVIDQLNNHWASDILSGQEEFFSSGFCCKGVLFKRLILRAAFSYERLLVTCGFWLRAAFGYERLLVTSGFWSRAAFGHERLLVTSGFWLRADFCYKHNAKYFSAVTPDNDQLNNHWASDILSGQEVSYLTINQQLASLLLGMCTILSSFQAVFVVKEFFLSVLSNAKLHQITVTVVTITITEEMLAESFNLFIEFCLSLLRKQRDLFPPTNKAALIKLEYLLRCLALIQSMQAFWQCCPFHKELPLEVINIVRKGTREWYDKMVALTKPETVNEESLTTSFIELTNIVTADIQRGFQYYNKIFEDILNISYFSVIYKQLDVLMTDDVAPVVMELCATLRKLQVTSDEITDHDLQMGTHMFELYMALQEFFKFKNNLTQDQQMFIYFSREQAKLHILNYAQWFSEVVNRWLIIARYKAMLRIRRAVELEKVVSQVDSLVKHSTSAVDTTSCFYQIKIFWKQLAWPDLLSAYVFVTKILDDICCGATYYADLMYTKLYEAGFYDEDGQFDVTEQLCIAINDMEHVRSSLRILPQELEFEAIIQAVDKSQGEVGGRQCRVAFESVLSSAIEDVENQIFKVVGHIGEKASLAMVKFQRIIKMLIRFCMRPDIRKYAFHLAWAPDGLPAEEVGFSHQQTAIVPLMEYLDNNLTTLNGTLLSSNFERILIIIWSVVMEEVQTQADSGIGEKHLVFFERLHGSLTIMMDFFHAEEKGLSLEMLKNQQYQVGPKYGMYRISSNKSCSLYSPKCQRFLSLNRTETLDLISKYYFEKLMEQQQKNTSCENGVLTVRVYFHNDCLCIEVISAKDILPLDTNGYSDPFVILQILPPRIFPNCPIQSTKVQKKTLQPFLLANIIIIAEPWGGEPTEGQCVSWTFVFWSIGCVQFSATLEQCKDPSSMIQLTVMDHDILLSNDFAGEAFVSLNHVPGVDEKMVEDVATLHGLKPIELNLLRSKQSENEILKVLEKRLWDKTALEFAKSQKAHSA